MVVEISIGAALRNVEVGLALDVAVETDAERRVLGQELFAGDDGPWAYFEDDRHGLGEELSEAERESGGDPFVLVLEENVDLPEGEAADALGPVDELGI